MHGQNFAAKGTFRIGNLFQAKSVKMVFARRRGDGFQQQRLACESAGIRRLFFSAAAIAFQMSTRGAGAEGRFASLLCHLTEHALQGTGEVALDTGRKGVRGADQ